jgi:hypothetical protein
MLGAARMINAVKFCKSPYKLAEIDEEQKGRDSCTDLSLEG